MSSHNFSSPRRLGMLLCAVALLPAQMQAQDADAVVRHLISEGHHYAARLTTTEADAPDALVADYFLNAGGTDTRITRWLADHPAAPAYDRGRLEVMRANLLVRQGNYSEALRVYDRSALFSLPEAETTEARICQALAYLKTGQTPQARSVLESLTQASTHQADILYLTGYVRYAEGDYREAIPFFESVSETRDYRRSAPVYVAACQLGAGRADRAEALAHAYLQDYPDAPLSLDAQRIEGEALYAQGRYPEAISALQDYADRAAQPQRKALYQLGMARYRQMDYAAGASALSRSASTERDAMAQNAWLHAGLCYLEAGQKRQAGMAFQQASEMDADPAVQEEALYNYALTLHDGATMGFGENVQAFERFLNQFPQSQYRGSVARHLTDIYFTTKNYPAALASINKIKQPSADILAAKQKVLYNLGVQAYQQGQLAQARDYMKQSLQAKSAAEPLLWKGLAEYRLADYTAAVTDLQAYLRQPAAREGNAGIAHYTLGYTYFKQQNYSAARQQFSLCPVTGSTGADALNRLGDCYFATRAYDQAYATYDQARRADPAQGDYSLLQQALISGLRGNNAQKVRLLQQVGTSYQGSTLAPQALLEQGRAYVQEGKSEQALAAFRQLADTYPESAAARSVGNEMGMVYSNQGKVERAIESYRNVINRYPNTAEAHTALANLRELLTASGRIDELNALAQQAGRPLSADELDRLTAEAALRAATEGNDTLALARYRQLEAQTASSTMRQQALNGQLDCAARLHEQATVVDVASRLLDPALKTPTELALHAQLLRAQSQLALGKANEAVADYQQLALSPETAEGAQATVELAQYAYDTKQLESAEKLLTTFTEGGTPQAYWLARAFVLLSDVYAATGRDIEARQYLLSLRSNYTESKEINQMIAQRLAKLK